MEEDTQKTVSRPPVVVVMGHIDHGKTTLLDYIRKSNVVGREAGGITQHVGAYEIEHGGKKITFIDTPGHEAFSKMRQRSSQIADLAILVVASDDGVKPQTEEAYKAIEKAKIPFMVALNKIDKAGSDPERVKNGLAQIGVLLEGRGGDTPIVEVSAKEGTNISELLDMILLMSELQDLRGDREIPASGVVLESHMDSRRGATATLVIFEGSLKAGDFIVAGGSVVRARIMEDCEGDKINRASFSSPLIVAGFDKIPPVGVKFHVFKTKDEAETARKAFVASGTGPEKKRTVAAGDIGIMVKADVAGLVEALRDELEKNLPQDLDVKFYEGGTGDISESDIKMISACRIPYVIGFRVKVSGSNKELASRLGVHIGMHSVIYEAYEWVKEELRRFVPKKYEREDTGKMTLLKVFKKAGPSKYIIGGKVTTGKVAEECKFDIVRNKEVMGSGSILSLERNKVKVSEVKEGDMCGLIVEAVLAPQEKDTLNIYRERETQG